MLETIETLAPSHKELYARAYTKVKGMNRVFTRVPRVLTLMKDCSCKYFAFLNLLAQTASRLLTAIIGSHKSAFAKECKLVYMKQLFTACY